MLLLTHENQYLNLVEGLMGVLADEGVPEYLSKFSRRDYSLRQHIVLLVLRAFEGKTYRDFVEWVDVCDGIKDLLDLSRIPHYTTLQKVSARLKPGFLEDIMRAVGSTIVEPGFVAAVDSTGFSLNHSSHYYLVNTNRRDICSNYLKTTLSGDAGSLVVLSCRMRLKRRHDTLDFKPVLRKIKNNKPGVVVADKGYDSVSNYEFVDQYLKATPIISIKRMNSSLDVTYGVLRRKIKQNFPHKIYHQRSKIETIISMIKRKYGSTILSRKHRTKKNELLLKLIAHNCQIITKTIKKLLKGFYKARKL
jgi:transposase